MVDKYCKICKIELINVHHSCLYCNKCRKQKIKENNKKWKKNNTVYIKTQKEIYRKNNKDKYREYSKKYRDTHKDKIKSKVNSEYQKNWRCNNLDKVKIYEKNMRIKYREKRNKYFIEYDKNRINNDKLYKLSKRLRTRLYICLKNKSFRKNIHFNQYIGCKLSFLKQYLENQFQEGMSWDNHSLHGWHIDHIIPLSSAQTEEEMIKLCHYTNLQPLWAKDNLSKGNKF